MSKLADALELWADVPGWEGRYEVSSRGNLRTKAGRIVGQWLNADGYKLARLSQPRRAVRVHRLVAEAFIANPEGKPNVNHIDCNRANNNAENLEWVTQRENIKHAASLGRAQRNYWRGRRSPNASLTADQVGAIRAMYASGEHSYAEIAKCIGRSKRCVGRIICGETYADVPLPAPPKEKP